MVCIQCWLSKWMDVTSDKFEDLWTFLSLHRPYLLVGKTGTGGSINCYSLHGKQSGFLWKACKAYTPLICTYCSHLWKLPWLTVVHTTSILNSRVIECFVISEKNEDAQGNRWELIYLCSIWQLCKQAFWVDELIPVTGAAGPECRKGVQVRLSACSHAHELLVLRFVECLEH